MTEIITVPIRLEGKSWALIQRISRETQTDADSVASVVCWLALTNYGVGAEPAVKDSLTTEGGEP